MSKLIGCLITGCLGIAAANVAFAEKDIFGCVMCSVAGGLCFIVVVTELMKVKLREKDCIVADMIGNLCIVMAVAATVVWLAGTAIINHLERPVCPSCEYVITDEEFEFCPMCGEDIERGES